MARETVELSDRANRTMENVAYIRQMLAELRAVAEGEGAEMLCYLIEMAYVEAGDVLAGRRALSIHHAEGHKSPRMPL
ncbi:hypothetical protein J2045_002656 [Peteryoungia aggregata LMG 23059]|uniref:Uncharacterized protein n=1 Tax=Peteryoungia aggregata LMG 23059 TaxID=1368425 RepID=A0ABU0G8G8_9HYPH|nr:hypothetical protein [Peteryoungia aggregata]MDQ0421616.1 hypothetical protein [Peteryoungia aggregata LMG 23059]